LPTWALL